jgi:hypothetical protein
MEINMFPHIIYILMGKGGKCSVTKEKDKTGDSKKAQRKEEERVIQDRTFGLKNKNKSTKVQKFIKGVVLKVKTGGNIKGGESAILQRQLQEKNEKKKQEEKQALIDSLFKSVSNIQQQQPKEGEDPKSILCALFKIGQCKKGDKCKFSHDLDIGNKSAKIDIYTDLRDASNKEMETWNQDYLENVVNSKFRGKVKPCKEVCKHFIEALEKKTFGWLWECPNGEKCHYRHCLPPGYILKSDKEKMDRAKDQEIPMEEQIEFERAKLPTEGLTPVTKESFMAWKTKKREEQQKKREEELVKEAKKAAAGKFNSILSGRALFQYVPEIFKDEDDAIAEYAEEEKKEIVNEEEKKVIEKQWVKDEKESVLSSELIKNIKANIVLQNEINRQDDYIEPAEEKTKEDVKENPVNEPPITEETNQPNEQNEDDKEEDKEDQEDQEDQEEENNEQAESDPQEEEEEKEINGEQPELTPESNLK